MFHWTATVKGCAFVHQMVHVLFQMHGRKSLHLNLRHLHSERLPAHHQHVLVTLLQMHRRRGRHLRSPVSTPPAVIRKNRKRTMKEVIFDRNQMFLCKNNPPPNFGSNSIHQQKTVSNQSSSLAVSCHRQISRPDPLIR